MADILPKIPEPVIDKKWRLKIIRKVGGFLATSWRISGRRKDHEREVPRDQVPGVRTPENSRKVGKLSRNRGQASGCEKDHEAPDPQKSLPKGRLPKNQPKSRRLSKNPASRTRPNHLKTQTKGRKISGFKNTKKAEGIQPVKKRGTLKKP